MSFINFLPTIISVISTVIIALVGWGFRSTILEIRGEIKNNAENIDKNSASIEKVANRHGERMDKLENNFNDLKSDLPFIYVLREDFVRTMNNVESRIVGMDSKLDRLLEKSAQGGKKDG